MKKYLKCITIFMFVFLFVSPITANAKIHDQHHESVVETNGNVVSFTLSDLKPFEETTVFDDGYSSVKIEMIPDLSIFINTYSYDSGWSSGQVPWENSTLNINATSGSNYVRFSVVANGQYSRLSNFGNLSYRILLYSLSNTYAGIKIPSATNNYNALAEWSTIATLVQNGLIIGTKNMYVRTELNTNGNFRLSYKVD